MNWTSLFFDIFYGLMFFCWSSCQLEHYIDRKIEAFFSEF